MSESVWQNVWHMDDQVDRAYLSLMDAICSWERATGRDVTVVMIPHAPDERVQMSCGGKPMGEFTDARDAVDAALSERGEIDSAPAEFARLRAQLAAVEHRLVSSGHALRAAEQRVAALTEAVERYTNLRNAAAIVEHVLRSYAEDQHEDVPEAKALALAAHLAAALRATPEAGV